MRRGPAPRSSGGAAIAPGTPGSRPAQVGARLRFRDLLERRLRRPGEDAAGRREARAVTGAVPGPLGAVPPHFAAHVRADRRQRRDVAALVAIGGDALSVQLEDAPVAAGHPAQAAPVRPGEAIADQVVRIVDILIEVI